MLPEVALRTSDFGRCSLIKVGLSTNSSAFAAVIIKQAISEEWVVVLLCVGQTVFHYQHILRKQGIGKQTFNSSVVPINLLTDISVPGGDLRGVFLKIKTQVDRLASLAPDSKVLLLIDDASVLHAVAGSSQGDSAWLAFLHNCRALQPCSQGGYSFIAVVHPDIEEDALWIHYLHHAAHLVLSVEAFSDGSIMGYTGQVTCTPRFVDPLVRDDSAGQYVLHCEPSRWWFKSTDNAVALVQQVTDQLS